MKAKLQNEYNKRRGTITLIFTVNVGFKEIDYEGTI